MDVKAAGGTAAITLPSIPVRTAASGTAAEAGAPAGDQVTLSAAARQLVAGGTPPDLSRAILPALDIDALRISAEEATRAEKAKYNERFMSFVRDTLGVDKDVGISLSGKVIDVLKKMAAKLGIEEPGAFGKGTAKQDDEDLDPVHADSSVITLTFPKGKGGGSVSMFIDNDAFAMLGDVAPGDLEKGLVNMMDRGGSGDLMRKAMESGLFGERMLKDVVEHPEWRQAKARYGFSMLGTDSPPAFMIQSHDKPEYVETNVKDLSRRLLRIAKAAGA
ncbi:hypothetical protein [Azospirillum sp.]|uniref:hypothetical protein n=1 Tax=Azospirillum sp. TaxID=34012 RepID=UPI002D40E920|nr:hypothetical protein [Azospirillum sp.]HYD68401.1 hypothetical protein [Azospirillum sp.]